VEIFLFLMIKHAIVDLGFQPLGLGSSKKYYFGWPAHKQHYVPHGLLTVLVMASYTHINVAVALGILDYILHWHTDFTKTKIRNYFEWTSKDRQFWILNAVDQILHFTGYYIIVLIATSQI